MDEGESFGEEGVKGEIHPTSVPKISQKGGAVEKFTVDLAPVK